MTKAPYPVSSFVASDGTRIAFQYCKSDVCAKKPSVVLIHHHAYTKSYWNCLIKKLCPVANVYAPDLRCLGKSQCKNFTLERLTQDVVELLDFLGIKRTYLVGHTTGAIVALNFSAIHGNRVIRIVTAGANPRLGPGGSPPWPYGLDPKIIALAELLRTETDPAVIRKILTEIVDIIDPISCGLTKLLVDNLQANLAQFLSLIPIIAGFDIRSVVRQIQAPVLLTVGTNDPHASFGATSFLRSNIRNSAVVEFFCYGNDFPILQTKLFNQHVFDFFFVECDVCCAFVETIAESHADKAGRKCRNKLGHTT